MLVRGKQSRAACRGSRASAVKIELRIPAAGEIAVSLGAVLRGVAAVAVVVALGGVAASTASGTSVRTYSTKGTTPLRTSLFDPFSLGGSQRKVGFTKVKAAGASYVRVVARWSAIAPATRPKGSLASDPSFSGYSWGDLDATVTMAQQDGLTPIVDVGGPPAWALVKRPKPPNGGMPRISDLHAFATAIATHYDGKHGAPRVRVFQIWNEPNLSLDLTPVSASKYRSMINTFAASVHAVSEGNLVLAGDLDPFGNHTKRFHTTSPLKFMRSLLCVSMGNPKAKRKALRHPHATCKQRVYFDLWSHHPYTFNGPFGHARRPDDVSLGDLPQMRKVLRTALHFHHIVSSHGVQFWVTEFSWDTKPPRRHAAPIRLASRWTAEALYQMWRSGVSLVTWFGLQDTGGKSPYQSGLYFHSKSLARARAKPVRTAFRFPFVAYLGKRTVSIWGRDATSDRQLVTIQRRVGTRGQWRTVAKIRSNRTGIFLAKLRLAATTKDWLRATAAGSGKSLAFSLKRPSPKLRYGPWGN
jgi:Cellulase (glycosyl hydrolase family 5)